VRPKVEGITVDVYGNWQARELART